MWGEASPYRKRKGVSWGITGIQNEGRPNSQSSDLDSRRRKGQKKAWKKGRRTPKSGNLGVNSDGRICTKKNKDQSKYLCGFGSALFLFCSPSPSLSRRAAEAPLRPFQDLGPGLRMSDMEALLIDCSGIELCLVSPSRPDVS